MPRSKVMFITKPPTWRKIVRTSTEEWPISSYWAGFVRRNLEIGDEVLVYITQKSAIAGVLEVRGELQTLKTGLIFSGGVYECSLPITMKFVLKNADVIAVKPFIHQLDLTKKNPSNWGSQLQRAVKGISDHDFDLLRLQCDPGTCTNV